MKTTIQQFLALIPIGLLMGSCASTQRTATVNDDVYFMPSSAPAPVMASASALPPEQAAATDDYYDAKTSQQLGADRNYYDMTYNDPYYYNYGRFGFGTGLAGWQSGWNGPGWGMGMGYGMGNMYGYGGYGQNMYSPYYGGFNSPYNNFYGSGYGYNSFYGGGYGYGNYYSPYGNYGSGYVPVSYGDYRSTATYHRPSMGSGAGTRSSMGSTRPDTRNLIGLAPNYNTRSQWNGSTKQGSSRNTGLDPAREQRYNDGKRRSGTRSNHGIEGSPSTRPSNNGGSLGGTRSSPSIGGGGGTRSTPPRR